MERAPLRPVPRRPEGPVDPKLAIEHVGDRLPGLDEAAQRALALVELAGVPRGELELEDPGPALARGRKALRRSLFPLPGSGWCERAERLISDRLDDALEAPGPARLDVHLRNCDRCVEHELRLAQSIDALVAGFIEAHPKPAAPALAPPPPNLRVVERVAEPARAEPAAPAAPAPEPAPPARRRNVGDLAWNALYALAVVLAVIAAVLTALGVAGVDLL